VGAYIAKETTEVNFLVTMKWVLSDSGQPPRKARRWPLSQASSGELDVTRSIVALIAEADNKPVGVGFIIASNLVLTCAHVVNASLGRPLTEQTAPGGALRPTVILPLHDDSAGHTGARTAKVPAEVVYWAPPGSDSFTVDDIACLQTPVGALPAAVAPLALADPSGSQGTLLDLFGYPTTPPRPMGAWTRCRLVNKVAGGLWQLDQDPQAALHVQPGYSGSPLWDSSRGVAVGMLVVAAVPGSSGINAYAIPSSRLLAAWPGGATEENLQRSTSSAINGIQIRTKRARADADIDVSLSPQECLDACYRALCDMRLRGITVDAATGTLEARTTGIMAAVPWSGEKIKVMTQPRNFGCHVVVRSQPIQIGVLTNFGISRNNVVRVLVAVSDAIEEPMGRF
jgi:hypothetical protein